MLDSPPLTARRHPLAPPPWAASERVLRLVRGQSGLGCAWTRHDRNYDICEERELQYTGWKMSERV